MNCLIGALLLRWRLGGTIYWIPTRRFSYKDSPYGHFYVAFPTSLWHYSAGTQCLNWYQQLLFKGKYKKFLYPGSMNKKLF